MYEKRSKQTHQGQMHMIRIEDLVTQDHFLRKIDVAIDFSFIYDEVAGMYSDELGRPGIDLVALFKIVMIQYIFGIHSMRQTIKEIEVNNAYRWFIGYFIEIKLTHIKRGFAIVVKPLLSTVCAPHMGAVHSLFSLVK